ncbi:GGDEF domain-containing protein [Pseudohaliea sp.]|uniref:GGDEF domain-containing protein n=1 Tax=Pseudohaliea sp. TaxID=2740289 RepID=UPI0032ED14E2
MDSASQLKTFLWDEHFITGIEAVDDQHRALVDLINDFGRSLCDGSLSPRDCAAVVARLRNYTEYHFREEEALMRGRGLHPLARENHEQAHRAFEVEVERLERDLAIMEEDEARGLHDYLVHWLGYHILGIDQSMARQLTAIAEGKDPEQAYNTELARDAGPLQPLLDAIVGLLHIVEEKNRELRRINTSLESQVESRTRELRRLSDAMHELAMQDQLTGLPNRRRATDFLDKHWADAAPLSCLMIDLDHFKDVNDQQGHDAGDEVLRQVAREIRASFRTDDLACRLGGDEFLVLCPATPQAEAMQIGEKVRSAVEALGIKARGSLVTLSVGVASRSVEMQAPKDLLRAADESLYGAKHMGRNAVCTAAMLSVD